MGLELLTVNKDTFVRVDDDTNSRFDVYIQDRTFRIGQEDRVAVWVGSDAEKLSFDEAGLRERSIIIGEDVPYWQDIPRKAGEKIWALSAGSVYGEDVRGSTIWRALREPGGATLYHKDYGDKPLWIRGTWSVVQTAGQQRMDRSLSDEGIVEVTFYRVNAPNFNDLKTFLSIPQDMLDPLNILRITPGSVEYGPGISDTDLLALDETFGFEHGNEAEVNPTKILVLRTD